MTSLQRKHVGSVTMGLGLVELTLGAWLQQITKATTHAADRAPLQVAQDAPFGAPYPAGADWQSWVQAESARVRAERPELYDAVQHMQPVRTRPGFLRLVGPGLEQVEAAPILILRLLDASAESALREALAEVLARTGLDLGPALLGLLQQEQDARVRRALMSSTRRARPSFGLSSLRLGLGDPSPEVRAEALRFVVRHPQGEQLAESIGIALSDPESAVRLEAIRAIGQLDLGTWRDHLPPLLASPEAAQRLAALRALLKLDAVFARELPAVRALASDPDLRVRRLAPPLEGARH